MSLLPSIHVRLQQAAERHEEIALLLATQEVMANQNRFRDLSVEYSQLEPIVTTWSQWQQAGQSIAEDKDLLKSSDNEMHELAREALRCDLRNFHLWMEVQQANQLAAGIA